MKLTRDQVLKVAKLARLGLTEEEIERFAGDLSDILTYVECLSELPTDDVEPTAQVTGLVNVFRDDEVDISENAERLLGTTNLEVYDNQIKVPPVF
jgi:aspartyl-tRNA(Asn)/glutamyl-tRNA(Gln) amidotransferase subunit C